jgi:glutamine amidotransferase
VNIGIVNCEIGNLRSVFNAFNAIQQPVEIIDHPSQLKDVDAVVLPGVGAFGNGIQNLNRGGWVETLNEEVRHKEKPFLGICVGMQVLATVGKEHGTFEGLNWIPGTVDLIRPEEEIYRIPHIGWNDVQFVKRDGLFKGLGESADFYFVHSYAHFPESADVISGICDYGMRFAASFEDGNIFATQFHPEKSQKAGLAVLRNFVKLAERIYA